MDYALNNKRRVVRLVLQWAAVCGDLLQEDDVAMAFLEVHGWWGGVSLPRIHLCATMHRTTHRQGSFPGGLASQILDFVNTFLYQKGTTRKVKKKIIHYPITLMQ